MRTISSSLNIPQENNGLAAFFLRNVRSNLLIIMAAPVKKIDRISKVKRIFKLQRRK